MVRPRGGPVCWREKSDPLLYTPTALGSGQFWAAPGQNFRGKKSRETKEEEKIQKKTPQKITFSLHYLTNALVVLKIYGYQ